MKITYDKDVHALYIQIADGDVHRTIEMREGLIADFGAQGQLLGIEILNERDFLSFLRLGGVLGNCSRGEGSSMTSRKNANA